MSAAYSVDNANVLQEVIDNEVIMINLANDKYYTMNETGQYIWMLLQQGCGIPTIVNMIVKQTNAASVSVKNYVKSFVDQLLAERLIVASGAASNMNPALPAGMVLLSSGCSDPLLKIFTDLQAVCID